MAWPELNPALKDGRGTGQTKPRASTEARARRSLRGLGEREGDFVPPRKAAEHDV